MSYRLAEAVIDAIGAKMCAMSIKDVEIGHLIDELEKELKKKNPPDPAVMVNLYSCQQHCCDWRQYKVRMNKLSELVDQQLLQGVRPLALNPMESVALFPLSLQQRLDVTRSFTHSHVYNPNAVVPYRLPGKEQQRLRIGYISSATETLPLLGKRSRHHLENFEIFHYNWDFNRVNESPEPDGRSTSNDQHFVDLTKMNNTWDMAQRIFADGIQILVNLDDSVGVGWKSDDTMDAILTMHPAPIQVVYRCGFGSSASACMEYFISDKIVSPLGLVHGYSEKLAYLPNGMFVCDNPHLLEEPPLVSEKVKLRNRRRFRLPEGVVVFGVSAEAFMIDPPTFGLWCEILKRVPKSVLWFVGPHNDLTEKNLRHEAKQLKINPYRLVFVEHCAALDWPLLLPHIDLMLDTPSYNDFNLVKPMASAIPVVTMPKESFPTRSMASILTFAGLPELVANSPLEYEEIAVSLSTSRDMLSQMKTKITSVLRSSPYFDVDGYFRDLENLYQKMWKRHMMNEPPDHLV